MIFDEFQWLNCFFFSDLPRLWRTANREKSSMVSYFNIEESYERDYSENFNKYFADGKKVITIGRDGEGL